MKRQRWSNLEDDFLLKAIKKDNNSKKKNWLKISKIMEEFKIFKGAKQCKERFNNNLDPFLNKKRKWSKSENRLLFELHRKTGNKWTEISKYFEGRSHNCVKNQFFLLIRKSLRNLKRKGNLNKDYSYIGDLRAKILGNFINTHLNLDLSVDDTNEVYFETKKSNNYFLKNDKNIRNDLNEKSEEEFKLNESTKNIIYNIKNQEEIKIEEKNIKLKRFLN